MSNTIGINVKDESNKVKIMEKLRLMPGNTDAEKLAFCLEAGMRAARISGSPYESYINSIRASQARTVDLVISTLESSDVDHETALAEQNEKIKSLEDQVGSLQKANDNSLHLLDQANKDIEYLNAQINALKHELETKNELILSLQDAQKKHESQVSQEADINARLKVIEDKLQAINGAQLSFISPN